MIGVARDLSDVWEFYVLQHFPAGGSFGTPESMCHSIQFFLRRLLVRPRSFKEYPKGGCCCFFLTVAYVIQCPVSLMHALIFLFYLLSRKEDVAVASFQ